MTKSIIANDMKQLIGQTVWFRTSCEDINSGVLECVEGMDHAKIVITVDANGKAGVRHVHANDIYMTKEDLLSANYERFTAKVNSYARKINDVTDLVKFCYDHFVKCESIESEARIAARNRAMELLGVEIDSEAAAQEKEIEELLAEGE